MYCWSCASTPVNYLFEEKAQKVEPSKLFSLNNSDNIDWISILKKDWTGLTNRLATKFQPYATCFDALAN